MTVQYYIFAESRRQRAICFKPRILYPSGGYAVIETFQPMGKGLLWLELHTYDEDMLVDLLGATGF